MPRRSSPWSLALGAAVVFAGALLWRYRDYVLMGWDVYPEILTSRIQSVDDFVGTFVEQTSEGFYPSAFYRPIMNLSLALDYALWGIEPIGYRLSACLLAGAGALAMFGMCRSLLGTAARLGPWAGLLGFMWLPVHGEVVPLDSTRMDPLCALFCMTALALQFRASNATLAPCWRAALCTLLAVGSKEAGVLIVPVVAVLATARATGTLSRRAKVAALATLPHLLAVLLVFAARFAALGQLGGHPSTSSAGALTRLPLALGLVVTRSTGLWTTDFGRLPAPLLASLSLITIAAMLLLSLRALRAPMVSGPGLCALAALAWFVSIGGIYGASGIVQSWHLLLPSIAACLLCAAAAEQGARTFRSQGRAASLALFAAVLVWLGAQARHSPLVRPFGHWDRGNQELSAYLGALASFIEHAPDGALLRAPGPPQVRRADPNPIGSAQATLINYYSLPAWAELRFPERRVVFRHPTLGNDSQERVPNAVVVHLGGTVQ